ncbi:MAG: sugar nucleotide-binding protein [Vicinamibacterales bacterium]
METRTPTVAVLGAGGQLGQAISARFARDGVVHAFVRSALDITDAAAVAAAFDAARPDVVINCAAFNDVDGAEERPSEALSGQRRGRRRLARAAERTGAVFVHYGPISSSPGASHACGRKTICRSRRACTRSRS